MLSESYRRFEPCKFLRFLSLFHPPNEARGTGLRTYCARSPVFLSGDGGDEGALSAAHVADHADQLAGPHVAAAVLQDDALRGLAVLAVVHVRRQRAVVGTARDIQNGTHVAREM